ncbi:MAG TPA: enoyl-CoA hydratase [Stellaceae bacterium]|nr:enoyl-CoA hydratase [Stellaceae bacterium]
MRLELATERMIAEIDGAVGWMIFNNPDRRNAVSLDMWEAIPTILDRFEADSAVRVIVLRGAGDKAFVSGADISQFEQQRADPAAVAHYDRVGETATNRLAASPKPTIAMIRGFCIGGGVGIASSCDLRIAADDARLAVPAAKLGLGYRWSGVKKLVDLVGPSHAKEIFFTARQFTATEAHAMGLLTRVVPVDDLDAFISATIDQIAANAPLTMLAAKRTIDELTRTPDQLDRAMCEELVRRCFASEDYIEGRRAFMEKRKPVFQGK